MKRNTVIVLLLFCASVAQQATSCSWAIGYFYQVTNLRGTLVGMSRGWPRWVRQRVKRDGVTMRLYQYRWPVNDYNEMPLVKTVTTDGNGRFDFGTLKQGHYTLVIDWPEESANWFNVEIKKLPKATASTTIDVSPVYPDCTGGHEFIALSE